MKKISLILCVFTICCGSSTAYADCNPASGTKAACQQIQENEAIKGAAKKNILEMLKSKPKKQ
ncbi:MULTISPECIES: hypothetical protein [unclassified Agarivorans]|uniref:hypothetical protein n=1 Tax=unclassified Agarivorans TaxID=2636026 RepID=UPI003D7CB07A